MGQYKANKMQSVRRYCTFRIRSIINLIKVSDDKIVIFVTNEIGLGIVPDNKLARYFRDIAGRVNRTVATEADKLYLTISGVTIELKSQEVHING